MKPSAYIFDVDGTLVNTSSIIHHVQKKPKDFKSFHSEALYAPPHQDIVEMANKAKIKGHKIIIVTARESIWKSATQLWLAKHEVRYDALYMRNEKDYRPDYDIKKDILNKIIKQWRVVHAVDDNPDVIKLWKENGIPTTTVEGWNG